MLTVDSKTVTEIRKESRHFTARLVFGSKNYDEIDSFTYTSHYSPQKFTVGCVPSASVQCDIRNLDQNNPFPSDLKGQVFRLEISVGEKTKNYTPEWISLGEFKITEASVKDGVFSLTAYDKINFIKGDYKSNLTGTQTIADIFNDVCSKIQKSSQGFTATNADGKGYVKDTVSSSYTLDVELLKGYPLKDVLSYIAAIFARNLTVNRQGLFELKAYKKPGYDLLNDDRIETPELNNGNSTFGYLSAAVDSDTILTSGETNGSGLLFSCPVMTQKRLDYLQGLLADETHAAHSFRPGKVVQLLGDPRIEVGDVLPLNPVYNAEGNVVSADCYIPVMSLVMKYDGGLMNEITAYDFEEDTSLSAAQRIDFAEKSAKRVTKYATAAAEFSNIISGGLGLYKTDHIDLNGAVKTYLHDQPSLSDSTYIVSFTSTGIASSNKWGGTHDTTVWTSGVDLYGNAVMKTIAANKITADLIDVTDFSALKATIGGWKITSSRLYYPSEKGTDGKYTYGLGLAPKSSGIAFYAGYQSTDESVDNTEIGVNKGTPWEKTDDWQSRTKFYVQNNGKLVAKGADISGDITATSLTLDGCKISYKDLSDPPNLEIYLKKDGTIERGTVKDGTGIKISSEGLLQASNAVIYGTIYASSGTIGGWNIDGSKLYLPSTRGSDGTYSYGLGLAPNASCAIYSGYKSTSTSISNTTDENSKGTPWEKTDDWRDRTLFYVLKDGTFCATKGYIAKWNIIDNLLFNPSDSSNTYGTGMNAGTGENTVAFYAGYRKASSVTTGREKYKGTPWENTDGKWESRTKFYIRNNGSMVAKDADIIGKITATSGLFKGDICAEGGTIGGFDIKSYYIVTNGETWGTDGSLFLSSTGSTGAKSIGGSANTVKGWVITAGSRFGVTSAGRVYASGASLSGSFTSSTGSLKSVISGGIIQLQEYVSNKWTTYGTISAYKGTLRVRAADTIYHRAYSHIFAKPSSNNASDESKDIEYASMYTGSQSNDPGVKFFDVRKSVLWYKTVRDASDRRLKENITNVYEQFEKIFMELNPCSYNFIGKNDMNVGFIAQEVQDVLRKYNMENFDVVGSIPTNQPGFDGYMLGLNYLKFIPLNTHMIQKCLKEIETLKNEISILKGATT